MTLTAPTIRVVFYVTPRGRPRLRPPCSVNDCDRGARELRMCSMHATRARRHGDPHVVIANADRDLARGPRHPHWVDSPGYSALHDRIHRRLGPATAKSCAGCGAPARNWCYDHRDPDEHADPRDGWPYSTDLRHYTALCISCHRRLDFAVARRRRQGLPPIPKEGTTLMIALTNGPTPNRRNPARAETHDRCNTTDDATGGRR